MAKEDTRPLPAAPQEVLDGRYRIERLLGRGGMGAVFLGEHLLLRTRVAIKFLLDTESDEAVARFAREAQVTARLTSPHAIRVMDVATPSGRPPYIVMEYLNGRDLESLLSDRGPMSVEAAVGYVLQACDALAEAHAAGVVHRDLKPGNLFLARQADGSSLVKVLDFGLSKVIGALVPQQSLSSTTAVMGSPGYMSPEQLRSTKKVDERTDVWAMGVVLYELLTGALPFRYESSSELLIAIASEPYVPARSRRDALPLPLEKVFSRCFEKKADKRFASIAEFARAIAPYAGDRERGLLASIERRGTPDPQLEDTLNGEMRAPNVNLNATTQVPVATSVTLARRRRLGAAAAAVVGLTVLGAAWFGLFRKATTAPVPAAQAASQPEPVPLAAPAAAPAPTSETAAPLAPSDQKVSSQTEERPTAGDPVRRITKTSIPSPPTAGPVIATPQPPKPAAPKPPPAPPKAPASAEPPARLPHIDSNMR